MMMLALSASTSNNFQREAYVNPWLPFQPGECETAKAGWCHPPRRRNRKTNLAKHGWMDGSAPTEH